MARLFGGSILAAGRHATGRKRSANHIERSTGFARHRLRAANKPSGSAPAREPGAGKSPRPSATNHQSRAGKSPRPRAPSQQSRAGKAARPSAPSHQSRAGKSPRPRAASQQSRAGKAARPSAPSHQSGVSCDGGPSSPKGACTGVRVKVVGVKVFCRGADNTGDITGGRQPQKASKDNGGCLKFRLAARMPLNKQIPPRGDSWKESV